MASALRLSSAAFGRVTGPEAVAVVAAPWVSQVGSRLVPPGFVAEERAPGFFRLGSSDGEAIPWLLLPGFEGDARVFCGFGGGVASRAVFAADLPLEGHRLADLAELLLRRLPAPRVLVVGFSLGGLVGRAMAELEPDRIAGLVTVGTIPSVSRLPLRLHGGLAFTRLVPDRLFVPWYRRRIEANMALEGVDAYVASQLAQGLPERWVVVGRLSALLALTPSQVPAVPCIWVRPEEDREAPWTLQDARADLPGIDCTTTPGGHRCMLTHPEPLRSLVVRFASRVGLG